MDAKENFTVSHGWVVKSRRAIVSLMIAALLALGAVVTQNTLSMFTGIGSVSVALACHGSGGTGAC